MVKLGYLVTWQELRYLVTDILVGGPHLQEVSLLVRRLQEQGSSPLKEQEQPGMVTATGPPLELAADSVTPGPE